MNYQEARRLGVPVLAEPLIYWCEEVQLSSIQYSRIRKKLWSQLTELVRQGRHTADDNPNNRNYLSINSHDWTALKSCLTSKQENLTDDKKLAIDTVVTDILGFAYAEIRDETPEKETGKKRSKEEKHVKNKIGLILPEPDEGEESQEEEIKSH